MIVIPMNISVLVNKWKLLVGRLNSLGIPMPTVRDPKSGMGSVSLTLVFVSSLLVIAGLIGKWSGKLGGIDVSNALQFFYASSTLYFGRNWKSNKDGSQSTVSADTDSNVK